MAGEVVLTVLLGRHDSGSDQAHSMRTAKSRCQSRVPPWKWSYNHPDGHLTESETYAPMGCRRIKVCICISVKVSKRKGSEFGVPDAFIVIPSGLSGIACTIDRTAEML